MSMRRGFFAIRRFQPWVVLAFCCVLSIDSAHSDDDPGKAAKLPPRDASLVVQLARDPAVQDELRLKSEQKETVAALVADVEYPIFLLRDVPADQKREEREALANRVEDELRRILEQPQRQRLSELLLRAQGYAALLEPPHAASLGLSDDQTARIRGLLADAQKGKGASPGTNIDKQVLSVLTTDQNDQLARLIGRPFELARVRVVACRAPELRDIESWINSRPLSFEQLKGRVVAVHFWAFGCSNCINNLPHYNAWHQKYADRGLTVLGLHTPETQAERSIDGLARQVANRKISYPVAADSSSTNWQAWANHLWPSVYLVDRQGYVRYWWYGELNWQGAKGEELMRKRIEQLLSEEQ